MEIVDAVKHYQRSIEKCSGNEERMLHCISKLYHLPVTVQHLQDTGVGRTVNALRKYVGDTGEAAKTLVAKWKAMVAAEDSSEGECATEPNNEVISEPSRGNHHKHGKDHHKFSRNDYHRQENHKSDRYKSIHREQEQSNRKQREDDNLSYHRVSKQHAYSHKRKSKELNSDSRREEKRRRKQVSESSSENAEDESDCEESRSGSASEDGNNGTNNSREESQESQESDSSSTEHVKYTRTGYHQDSHRKHEKHKERSHSDARKLVRKIDGSGRSDGVNSNVGQSRSKDGKDKNKHRKDEKRKMEMKKEPKENLEKTKSKTEAMHIVSIPESKHSIKAKTEKCKSKSSEVKGRDSHEKKSKQTEETEDGSIDCFSGASFAEALGMVDPVVKKKHPLSLSPGTSSTTGTPRSSSSKRIALSDGSGSVECRKSKESFVSKSYKVFPGSPNELGLLSPSVKLEPLDMDVDLDATLPTITPNYRPLPHFALDTPARRGKLLSEEEALSQVMSTKNQRTKVYSGVKSGKSWASVPSLYDICVRVLQENIDALEYTGGVPYDLLKPVLTHASPEQLLMLEHFNPYLIDDTDQLWEFHCTKQFRTKQRQEMETSREMYLRCLDEREAKLKTLTTNITQAIKQSTPVRKTKLAYVDSVAKPPRNVARQQAKYGTARSTTPSPLAKGPKSGSTTAVAISAPTPRAIQSASKIKPRMAPLMQKTMKLAKSFKR